MVLSSVGTECLGGDTDLVRVATEGLSLRTPLSGATSWCQADYGGLIAAADVIAAESRSVSGVIGISGVRNQPR
jgi:hypothetical protein